MESWQAVSGSSLVIIGKSFGHKNQRSSETYAHLDVEPVLDSMQRATPVMLTAEGSLPKPEVIPKEDAKENKHGAIR
jgi:hypothetical protein